MLRIFVYTWVCYWVVVLLLPVERQDGMLETFALQAVFVGIIASAIAAGAGALKAREVPIPQTLQPCNTLRQNCMNLSRRSVFSKKKFFRVVNLLTVLVLAAPSLLVFDKIFVDGLDYSQSLTRVRSLQNSNENSTSAFSILGYLFLSQVTVLSYLVITHLEVISKWRLRLSVGISLFAIVVFSFLIGGRSPLFVFLTVALTIYTINFQITIRRAAWMAFLGLIAVFFSGYIFIDRIEASGVPPGVYTSLFMYWLRLEPTSAVGGMSEIPAVLTLIGSYFGHSFFVANEILASNSHFNDGQAIFTFPTLLMSRLGLVDAPVEWQYSGVFSSITGQLYYELGLAGYLAAVCVYGALIYLCYYLIRRTQIGSTLNYLSCMAISTVVMTPMILPVDFIFFPFAFVFGSIGLSIARIL